MEALQLLAVIVVLLVIATPILAIVALSKVLRFEKQESAIPNLIRRVYALEQRLAGIENKLQSIAAGTSSHEVKSAEEHAAPPAVTPPVAPAHTAPAPVAPPVTGPFPPPIAPREAPKPREVSGASYNPVRISAPESKPTMDMETRIAGRWLNRVGIVALIFSVSYFLKYAFENNWIGPTGRVAIGILLGAATLPWSHWLLKRGYQYFSEGIAGLGAAVLYLSIWAGWHYYLLFSQNVAFGLMIVVTAVMTAVALGRDSQRIAVLSLVGGFLTPELVSTGHDAQIVLFTYVFILGAGILVIAARRDWRVLPPICFICTQIYFWGWYERFYRHFKMEQTLLFASLFFLLYSALPVLRALRDRFEEENFLIVLANNFAYLGALYLMLWPRDRWELTLFVLALAALHLFAERMIPLPRNNTTPVVRWLFAGLALTYVTLAIPIRLDGNWITLAFSVEGAILVWIGFQSLAGFLRGAGYLLLAAAGLRVLFLPLPARDMFFNERFAAYGVLIACIVAALLAAKKFAEPVGEGEAQLLGVFAVAANVCALIALSLEFWDHFGRASFGYDAGLAQHLSLSVLWTVYATILILAGVKRSSSLLRWQALALFGLVVVKVFVYDSSYLERFYRILSFFILGVVLIVVSFLYQKKFLGERRSP